MARCTSPRHPCSRCSAVLHRKKRVGLACPWRLDLIDWLIFTRIHAADRLSPTYSTCGQIRKEPRRNQLIENSTFTLQHYRPWYFLRYKKNRDVSRRRCAGLQIAPPSKKYNDSKTIERANLPSPFFLGVTLGSLVWPAAVFALGVQRR